MLASGHPRTRTAAHAPAARAHLRNLVVSEIVRPRANKGEGGGLSFYRDQNGADSDLVFEGSAGFTLVEPKSTKTASASPFDDSKRIRRHLARSAGPCPVAVVYGGDQPQRRGADTLIPWRELHRLDWQVPDRGVVV